MATFSQNGVKFTATKGTGLPSKYSNGNNGNFVNAEEDGVDAFVNAVEIDWNNAEFKSAVDAIITVPDNGEIQSEIKNIKTTGDLINIIAKQQSQIDSLIVMVKALYQAVN